MNIDLRRARRLETQVQTFLSELSRGVNISSISLSIYESAKKTLDDRDAEIVKMVDDTIRLTEARYEIRREIDKAKKSAIDGLISVEAELAAKIGVYEMVSSTRPLSERDEAVAISRLDTYRTNVKTSTSQAQSQDQVDLYTVIRQARQVEFASKLKELKKIQQNVRDEISSKNASTFITLSPETVETLREFKLVD